MSAPVELDPTLRDALSDWAAAWQEALGDAKLHKLAQLEGAYGLPHAVFPGGERVDIAEAAKLTLEGTKQIADADKAVDMAKSVEAGVVAAFGRGLIVKVEDKITAPPPDAHKTIGADSK